MKGQITKWNASFAEGLVTGTDGAVYAFSFGDCTVQLQRVLAGKTIPPDDPIAVTFQVGATGQALSVSGDDTTQTK
jgi:hypothetical protein